MKRWANDTAGSFTGMGAANLLLRRALWLRAPRSRRPKRGGVGDNYNRVNLSRKYDYPQSEFTRPWLIVVRPKASRCTLQQTLSSRLQKRAGSPGSRAERFLACTGSLTARSPPLPHLDGSDDVALMMQQPLLICCWH
jgi:hypothetical protein